MNGVTESGISRRRGAAAVTGGKSPRVSIVVAAVSFSLTSLLIFAFGHANFSSSSSTSNAMRAVVDDFDKDAPSSIESAMRKADEADESTSKQFRKWGAILRADLHLVDVKASGIRRSDENKRDGDAGYRGVKASFCKLDWDRYKKNPPSLPMFKMLVAASGCDKRENLVIVDLADAVRKTREYDKVHATMPKNDRDPHTIPPAGFVFHESRVGSTLAANALQAMDPGGHRVYSESHPINDALKACSDRRDGYSNCDADVGAQLLRDVVYLLGRTSDPREERVFFKVSSIGSKRIDVMRRAFPDVPWIFVYRDPVQTMMSHLDPEKLGKKKGVRGGGPPSAVCLRSRGNPPADLARLASVRGGREADALSHEEFCAAHLATLCESALREMKGSDNGRGAAVEYDGLVDKLVRSVIPQHFGVDVDEDSRRRVLDVAKTYSKSKTSGGREWEEDSKAKDAKSTPEIRAASELFLSESYSKLKRLSIE